MSDEQHSSACPSCGVEWANHLGIVGTCAENKRLRDISRHWEGHKFGTWYPWPEQVPQEMGEFIVAYIGKTGVAMFTPNKRGTGGRWRNGVNGHSTTTLVRYWMPMPAMPNKHINEKVQR